MPMSCPVSARPSRAPLLVLVLLLGGCQGPDADAREDAAATTAPAAVPATPAAPGLPVAVDGQPLPSLAPMLEQVMPAVVNVHSRTVERVSNPLMDDPFFRRFFGAPSMPRERIRQSLGSGVVVDAESGLVLTNNHVIDGATGISVTLADGRTLEGEFVGSDPETDVALIRIEADRLAALPLADSTTLRVGDFVVAVGNPFGLGQTVTSGIVSALGRQGLAGLGYQDFIQTDASINPGNSGGALVNLRGELVGINTAIFSPSGGNVGIGFAIPARLARDVMRQLLAFGEVRRGSLGVESQDITGELAELLSIDSRRGAVVTRVYRDSPAARAGVLPGDVVVAVDDQLVVNAEALRNLEGLLPVDQPLALRVMREGETREFELTLEPRPTRLDGASLDPRLAGAAFTELPERLRKRGISGVVVSEVDPRGRAAQSGLREGDLVFSINQGRVESLDALRARTADQPAELLLGVARGRREGVLRML